MWISVLLSRIGRAALEPKQRADIAAMIARALEEIVDECAPPLALAAFWHGGVFDDRVVVHSSSVDLCHIDDWDRLEEFLASASFHGGGLIDATGDDQPTQLEMLLAGKDNVLAAVRETVWSEKAPYARTQPKIGRNQPCPCGSGRKHKRCCG